VGYAIGRPIGDAVTRNRLRRRLRALMAAEATAAAGGLPAGWYLLGAGHGATDLEASDLADAVRGLVAQVRS
jgi:ribonuclease P protein component